MKNKIKKLFLLPNTLSCYDKGHWQSVIPQKVRDITVSLDLIFAETPKIARNLLKELGSTKPIQKIDIYPLNQQINEKTLDDYVNLAKERQNSGILSDAGCITIADPGAPLIKRAHAHGIKVIPLVGPSSVLLALMASGLNGQNFCFNGYLPKNPSQRNDAILALQRRSSSCHETQIFIETPYRNELLFNALVKNLDNTTTMSTAIDLTMPGEKIYCHSIEEWKMLIKSGFKLNARGRQTIFLFLAHQKVRTYASTKKSQQKTK